MKKNILTVIILAIALINTVLIAVLIFVIVPTSNKTNQLVAKVASLVDLELESPEIMEVEVGDIATYEIAEQLTINLKSADGKPHYALCYVSLSMNSKHEDYAKYSGRLADYENSIEEIVTEEFGRYGQADVIEHKNDIREAILIRIKELFHSDFIINVTFGNIVFS